MPVLPRVTVSEAENFVDSGSGATRERRLLELSHAAPAKVAERIRNSLRCMKPPEATARCHQTTPRRARLEAVATVILTMRKGSRRGGECFARSRLWLGCRLRGRNRIGWLTFSSGRRTRRHLVGEFGDTPGRRCVCGIPGCWVGRHKDDAELHWVVYERPHDQRCLNLRGTRIP